MVTRQFSLRELLIVVTLVATSVATVRAGEVAILISFLPGAYLSAIPLRRDLRRNWEDCLCRILVCALGGGLSCPIITIGAGWAMGLLVQTIGDTSQPLPPWYWLLLIFQLAIAGGVLGAVYGAIETAFLWSKIRVFG